MTANDTFHFRPSFRPTMGVVPTRRAWLVSLAAAVALSGGAALLQRVASAQAEPCLGSICAVDPGFLAPDATGGAQDITLIYEQRGSSYASPADDLPLVARVSSTGEVLGPFLRSFLFLAAPAPGGGTYANPRPGQRGSDMADWSAFLRTTFDVGLPALEQAFATAQQGLTAQMPPLNIFLMVPYPSPRVSTFGRLGGSTLDLANEADRESALQWYVQTALAEWRAARPAHMRLAGFYWMREDALPYQSAEIHALAADVHAAGMRLLWIPCKSAAYAGFWATFGFDAAVLQPNYYVDGSRDLYGRPTSLAWTAGFAKSFHMGVELELNAAVVSSPARQRRFYAYLRQGAALGYEHGALIAIYQGTGAIARLADNPALYWLYNDLYLFTRGAPIPAAS
jgi:hypothetical protein